MGCVRLDQAGLTKTSGRRYGVEMPGILTVWRLQQYMMNYLLQGWQIRQYDTLDNDGSFLWNGVGEKIKFMGPIRRELLDLRKSAGGESVSRTWSRNQISILGSWFLETSSEILEHVSRGWDYR